MHGLLFFSVWCIIFIPLYSFLRPKSLKRKEENKQKNEQASVEDAGVEEPLLRSIEESHEKDDNEILEKVESDALDDKNKKNNEADGAEKG